MNEPTSEQPPAQPLRGSQDTRESSRLIALSLLGLVLFSPPLLLLFDREADYGFSSLPLIIYLIWALLILLAALILERPDAH